MITTAQLHRVAEKGGLRFDQAEKDYVILWLLSGLAHSGAKEHGAIDWGRCCKMCRILIACGRNGLRLFTSW